MSEERSSVVKARVLEMSPVPVEKASVLASPVATQTSVQPYDTLQLLWTQTGALEPPYPPDQLLEIYEQSCGLRPNIDAIATNVDGFGFRLDPVIDFEAPDAREKVAEALDLQHLALAPDGEVPEPPTDAEVDAALVKWKRLAKAERSKLDSFFTFAAFDESFQALRQRTRQDLETTGNAYWEVLRNGNGEIARFVYVQSFTCRLMPVDLALVETTEKVRVAPVTFETVEVTRKLRRFVQIQPYTLTRVYFRSFGDPRFIGSRTGTIFPTEQALVDSGEELAREMIHFSISSPRSPYGIPRWIGALMAVKGSHEADSVNYLYFQNKSVPPLALLVSGGSLTDEAVPRIQNYIEEHIKGVENFHKILIIEAEGTGTGGKGPRIELKPLMDAQQQDALFQQYDQRNLDKIGSQFRVPPLLRGDGKDFNRSVADAQLIFAEDQVFQPMRDEFDFMINRRIMPEMGARFWTFRTQTLNTRDPERLTDQLKKLMDANVLTPGEGRDIAEDILNRPLRKLNDDWTKIPSNLMLAGIQNGQSSVGQTQPAADPAPAAPPASPAAPPTVEQAAKALLALRDQLADAELEKHAARIAKARADGLEVEHVTVPASVMASWVKPS